MRASAKRPSKPARSPPSMARGPTSLIAGGAGARGGDKAGALATVDGKAPDALEQLAQKAGGPIRAVIDLVGNAATTQLGFDCLSKGGKLVIVGLFGGGAPWALPLIPIKAITIQGSYVGNLRETQELLELVRSKKIPPIPVTPMPLAKANDALVALQQGKLVGRAVLTP